MEKETKKKVTIKPKKEIKKKVTIKPKKEIKKKIVKKPIVEIKNLVKNYKKVTALDDFNLEIKEGEILGLLGPNGSGKTTCINCLLSLITFDKGMIKIFDKEMSPEAYDIKSKIGVIFQDVAVFNELTVLENIDYFCGLYISNHKLRKTYVEEAVKFVGLEEFLKFRPKQLSGGLLRRLNIACGIAHKPSLIFFDEPTVGVDPQSRNKILEGIKELNKKGATILYTTHYMEEAEQLCDRIVIIDKGKEIANGSKQELKEKIKIGEKVTIEVLEINPEQYKKISKIKNILDIEQIGNTINIVFKNGNHNLDTLIDLLKAEDIKYERFFSERPTLNDVFLEMTGKELRD
jgi:ABC-2 type transport system ATP-binding protein